MEDEGGRYAGRIVREGRDETKTESEKGVEGRKRAKGRMARRERERRPVERL